MTNWLYAAGANTPSQTNVTEYGPGGQYVRAIRPEGVTTLYYNRDGAVTAIVSPEGWLRYEYDPATGYLTRAYTINSDVRYGYDELNRLKTVTVVTRNGAAVSPQEVTTNLYTKLGSLQDVFYPNGVHARYEYDVMNRLTNLLYTGNGNLLLSRYSYGLHTNGWRQTATEIQRQVNGTYVTNQFAWGYDNLGRLTNETCSSLLAGLNYTNRYVYDLAGNRLWWTNITGAATVVSYTNNANDQLLVENYGSGSFTNYYDANGALTNRSSASASRSFSYSLEGRLAGTRWTQQTNRYFYNQGGIRVRKEQLGTVNATNIFLNDPQNLSGLSQVLEELPAAGATPAATYTLGNHILAQEKGGAVLHLLPDGHSSTRLLTDAAGVISNALTFDAYGNLIASNTAPQTAHLYTGERFDDDLEQYYLRARYYNPSIGRFGVPDQLDGSPHDPLTLHKYAYVQNNPVNNVDPSGNETLISMSIATTIATTLERMYVRAVVKQGWIASKKATELGVSRNSILDAASRNASPDADSAAIIVHGVSHKEAGWSQSIATPFQQDLTEPVGLTPITGITGNPLKHDFYEFNWGGFSIGGFGFVPIKSVHQMALVHLDMAQFLVWMNGYANIDLISHSWGTTLTYDLQNVSGVPNRHWVTMGSPLKSTTPKPPGNTGNWINLYDWMDPVIHLEMFPPFPDVNGLPLPSSLTGPGLTINPSIPLPLNKSYTFGFSLFSKPWVHSDYWISPNVATDLRAWLQ